VAGLSPGLSELLGGGLPTEAGAAAYLHAQAAAEPACLPARAAAAASQACPSRQQGSRRKVLIHE